MQLGEMSRWRLPLPVFAVSSPPYDVAPVDVKAERLDAKTIACSEREALREIIMRQRAEVRQVGPNVLARVESDRGWFPPSARELTARQAHLPPVARKDRAARTKCAGATVRLQWEKNWLPTCEKNVHITVPLEFCSHS